MGKTNELSGHRHLRSIFTLVIPARREAFEQLRAQLAAAAAKFRIPERETDHLLIAADEVFSNVAAYAYPDGDGTVEVRMAANADGTELSLAFSDRGIPFDPLAVKTPDTSAPLADRKIGGLGIHVVRRLMDQVVYRRAEDGRNILTLIKHLPMTGEVRP